MQLLNSLCTHCDGRPDFVLKTVLDLHDFCSPKHEAFMIGTTRSPNNKGFDLFMTTAPIPDLNDKIVLFGRVIKGEDIVQVFYLN